MGKPLSHLDPPEASGGVISSLKHSEVALQVWFFGSVCAQPRSGAWLGLTHPRDRGDQPPFPNWGGGAIYTSSLEAHGYYSLRE